MLHTGKQGSLKSDCVKSDDYGAVKSTLEDVYFWVKPDETIHDPCSNIWHIKKPG